MLNMVKLIQYESRVVGKVLAVETFLEYLREVLNGIVWE